MKTCCDCNESKDLSEFVAKASCKDGYEPRCRKCRSIKYNKSTPAVLAKKLLNTQIINSNLRGHEPPTYTALELKEWLLHQPRFPCLYMEWELAGYPKAKAPSIDRLDDAKGYTLDNIQLLTWEENRAKGTAAKKANTLIVNHRAVVAYNIDGSLYKRYDSMATAMREFGGKASQSWGISSVCNGTPVKDGKGGYYTPKTYKGFTWAWA